MDVVNALGTGPEEVWSQMMRKTCGIRPMTRFASDKYQTSVCAGITPQTESAIRARENCTVKSRAYLFAFAVARQAIKQIADGTSRINKGKTGLVLATTKADIDECEYMVSHPGSQVQGYSNPSILSLALAKELHLGGPVFAVSNACASGLVAIVQAARLLLRGDADIMIVVGVDLLADFILSGFSSLASLSRQPCRPYDVLREGLSLGEGAAAVILTCDTRDVSVLATVKGWGVSNDASHITGPSRTGEGLKLALSKTLNMAKMQPPEIDYVNGHGTGTIYNDEMESQALAVIFDNCLPPVTSMKGYFGHTLGAAGVIETVLCIMALHQRVVPGCLGFDSLGVSRKINVTGDHIYVGDLRNIITIKCGFGGVNAVLALSAANRR